MFVVQCSSSRKCADNRDMRINKYKNLTFRLVLSKKKFCPSRFEPTEKFHSGLYSVNRMSNELINISILSVFSWQLMQKTVSRYSITVIVQTRGHPLKQKLTKSIWSKNMFMKFQFPGVKISNQLVLNRLSSCKLPANIFARMLER
jgi:hypothetical protein